MTAIVTDAAAERAARAVITAGQSWEALKRAVQEIQDSKLTMRTVVALLSDELDMPMGDVQQLLTAITQFPAKFATVAA